MKRAVSLGAGILFCATGLLLSYEDVIKVETNIRPLRVGRGEEGKVILKIDVKEGIMINTQPAFIVEFSPSEDLVFPKNFFTASDLNVEVVEENDRERLNLKKPVEIPFTVTKKAKRGIHILEGKIKYFATSAKEGWCLKSSAKFSARILVVVKFS
jgi:hypothetical protein